MPGDLTDLGDLFATDSVESLLSTASGDTAGASSQPAAQVEPKAEFGEGRPTEALERSYVPSNTIETDRDLPATVSQAPEEQPPNNHIDQEVNPRSKVLNEIAIIKKTLHAEAPRVIPSNSKVIIAGQQIGGFAIALKVIGFQRVRAFTPNWQSHAEVCCFFQHQLWNNSRSDSAHKTNVLPICLKQSGWRDLSQVDIIFYLSNELGPDQITLLDSLNPKATILPMTFATLTGHKEGLECRQAPAANRNGSDEEDI